MLGRDAKDWKVYCPVYWADLLALGSLIREIFAGYSYC